MSMLETSGKKKKASARNRSYKGKQILTTKENPHQLNESQMDGHNRGTNWWTTKQKMEIT